MKKSFICTFLPLFSSLSLINCHQPIAVRESSLLISTLDGTLHAVGQKSGIIKWSIHESPILKLPSMANITHRFMRTLFLPDPKDGSLYLYNAMSTDDDGASRESLEKLPFTISELVSASPCRSTDGYLYTGKKIDEWIMINAQTGDKMDILNSESPMCPSPSTNGQLGVNALYLGKSDYYLSMFDLKTNEKTWNLAFVDYSSSASVSIPQSNYDFLHLTSSTTGRIATIDLTGDSNRLLWTHQFASPIVTIFQFNDGVSPVLRRVPFSTIGGTVTPRNLQQHNPLYPSLYIGEMDSGNGNGDDKSIYALSTLVDLSQTSLISTKKRRNFLIEGPRDDHAIQDYDDHVIIFGYYEYPQLAQNELITQLQLTQTPKNNLLSAEEKPMIDRIIPNLTVTDVFDNYHEVVLSLIALVSFGGSLFAAVLLHLFFRRKSSPQSKVNKQSTDYITVGKINFDPKAIIGRGCSGTCVYKGHFEGKQKVAVKRVIADYFVLADREIELLRSLQHPNLIRYFATESDHMFRYIAIELAEITLSDYIESKHNFPDLNDIELIEQSSYGLQHLHSLNVIHRDIKPQNILISLPLPPNGKRKAMISDFGVSKVLNSEHSFSYSEVSVSIKGTEGWIPPEVLKAKYDRITFKPSKPNDIFSLGCLFYYVFTNGQHPFGSLLHRQSNILQDLYDIEIIKVEESLTKYSLIKSMINIDPSKRPMIEAVVKHPLFWDYSKSLQFLQDVSDRIEKEPYESPIMMSLEKGGSDVTKGDWRRHISLELQSDLKKFRSYRGSSVRDLLRAMRNKRHHYRELPDDVREALGSIPNEFVNYFVSRFPRLLIHSYIAMQCCKDEHVFDSYYHCDDFLYEPLPWSGIKWYLRNNDSFMPNGVGNGDGLGADNWKSCKRKGSPIKKLQKNVPDFSPKYEQSHQRDDNVQIDNDH